MSDRLHKSEVSPGMLLAPDGNFDCMTEGVVKTVYKDRQGALFVVCRCGNHYLDGAEDVDGYLVGLRRWQAKWDGLVQSQ